MMHRVSVLSLTCLLVTFTAGSFQTLAADPSNEPVRQFPASDLTGEYNVSAVDELLNAALEQGAAERGAVIFSSPQFACISCHKVGDQGGTVGPELSRIGQCLKPNEIAEALLWPNHRVLESYVTTLVALQDGSSVQGYKVLENDTELVLRDPQLKREVTISKDQIEDRKETGSLMPAGLLKGMQPQQRADLVKFLTELGHHEGLAEIAAHAHKPTPFPYVRDPLFPEEWPNWQAEVNRDRVYDYYSKEASWFARQSSQPMLLPEFPGLDDGQYGHWGNQNEQVWADGRWNSTDLGNLLCGIFRGAGKTVAKGVCFKVGDNLELSACFDPVSMTYAASWRDGFVSFSDVRHGFMHGLTLQGTPLAESLPKPPAGRKRYLGFYRDGEKVAFAYELDDVVWLDMPTVADGTLSNIAGPADGHPHRAIMQGGKSQWPEVLITKGTLGATVPYAVDTIGIPFENPWKSLMFFGGHDFDSSGAAYLCSMQGDVWKVTGLDQDLDEIRWKRFASGLNQPQGVVVHDGQIFIQGRDQITRLHDLNGDEEADFYECFSNVYETSPAGHDFICGLERDLQGRFYSVSGNQGLFRISADGRTQEILATGFRNPDGLGLTPEEQVTVPCSEGEWTPASMICEVPASLGSPLPNSPGFYGYGGPKNGQPPELPLVYLPRGLDNSSGGQLSVTSDRWGPLKGQMLHFSFGTGAHFLLLRQPVSAPDDSPIQPLMQGAVIPLPGEFLSGAHRARFSPHDGQLYVSGMAGWGSYTPQDGSFQRVRYTGKSVQLPVAFEARRNGMLVTFSHEVDPAVATATGNAFAQAWNYRYSSAYGSAEYSPSHTGVAGHDHWRIQGVHVLGDRRTVFYEIPEMQPVNTLHLQMNVGSGRAIDLFATVHVLGKDFTDFPTYAPVEKSLAAHPLLVDLATATSMVRNPFRQPLPGAREVNIEAGSNLTYSVREIRVKAGEPVKLTFLNPDVVPHNWVLAKPGSLQRVGDLGNRLISDPQAVARHYVPQSDDVLYWTDVVPPTNRFSIFFKAPLEPGRYPYLCTFPGHWMVMNGELIVE